MPAASLKNIHVAALREIQDWMLEKDEEPPHVEHVALLALQLFDQLAPLHGLGAEERSMLHAAALLHDIGWSKAVEGRKHHKIAARMIREHSWKQVPASWVPIVACVARYHRRSPPRPKHKQFASLPEDHQKQVRKLAAILRIADGLDRAHLQRVRKIEATIDSDFVQLRLLGSSDLRIERKGASKKADLFEQVYSRKIRFT